jgi:hypothetical protein
VRPFNVLALLRYLRLKILGKTKIIIKTDINNGARENEVGSSHGISYLQHV